MQSRSAVIKNAEDTSLCDKVSSICLMVLAHDAENPAVTVRALELEIAAAVLSLWVSFSSSISRTLLAGSYLTNAQVHLFLRGKSRGKEAVGRRRLVCQIHDDS